MTPEEKRRLGWAATFVIRKFGVDSDVRAVCHAVEKYLLAEPQRSVRTGSENSASSVPLVGDRELLGGRTCRKFI
jgi:hypothetical protein